MSGATQKPVFPSAQGDSRPMQDRTTRFPVDALLRKFGYRIRSRKGNAEPEWEKAGVVLPQEEVLKGLGRDVVEDARYMEFLARGEI